MLCTSNKILITKRISWEVSNLGECWYVSQQRRNVLIHGAVGPPVKLSFCVFLEWPNKQSSPRLDSCRGEKFSPQIYNSKNNNFSSSSSISSL